MTISNDYIADQFTLLSKLMDIHGENSFKTRSYSSAAFAIEKLPAELTDLPPEKFVSIKGIGDAIGKKITQILTTGELPLLREYIEKTPAGVIEMLRIKGLGPKKISTIWKEMGVESIGELLYACEENRLLLYKGFGEKTQANTRETIEFFLKSQGSHLYAEVEAFAQTLDVALTKAIPLEKFALTGEFRRQLPVIDRLEWVTTAAHGPVKDYFERQGYHFEEGPVKERHNTLLFKSPEGVLVNIYVAETGHFQTVLFRTSCSAEFLTEWTGRTGISYLEDRKTDYPSELAIFDEANIPFIPSPERELATIISRVAGQAFPDNSQPAETQTSGPASSQTSGPAEAQTSGPARPQPIQPPDIRAIIHSHSKWSDGSNTLEEMAKACIAKGYEYLVISDHSKSAFYANGLTEDRIREQHKEITELNNKLAPFVIFKSIECDILNDGALDYSDDILSTFDLVIASVHSNLKMTQEKAMGRLLRAIENPYTTILGHLTGRLLLSRPGYPVDHRLIIDACAANQVVIELNAHPRRLDMDWKWISYALDKGVLISIDPDAHSLAGYEDVRYGVLAAQKGGLTAERNLSSYGLEGFRAFLEQRRKARGI